MPFAKSEMPGDCARRLSRNRMADQEFRGNESRSTALLASCHPSRTTPPGRGDSPGPPALCPREDYHRHSGRRSLTGSPRPPAQSLPPRHTDAACMELRAVLTAYAAVYVTLAELLDDPLVTCDRKIALASGHRAAVEVI